MTLTPRHQRALKLYGRRDTPTSTMSETTATGNLAAQLPSGFRQGMFVLATVGPRPLRFRAKERGLVARAVSCGLRADRSAGVSVYASELDP